MSNSLIRLQELENKPSDLTLTVAVIGQTSLDLLGKLIPRQSDFSLTSATIINHSEDQLDFQASFLNLQPWGEVEAIFRLFDLGAERHLIFHFQIPSSATIGPYVFLTQYSVDPVELLAESEETAPYIPLADFIQTSQFVQDAEKQLILFSSFNFSGEGIQNVHYPLELEHIIPSENVQVGLNFLLNVSLTTMLSDVLEDTFGGTHSDTVECLGNIYITENEPYFKLEKPAIASKSIVNQEDFSLNLSLSEFTLVVILQRQTNIWPEFRITGSLIINNTQFSITADLDIYYQTLSITFTNLPSIQTLFDLLALNELNELFPDPLSSLLDVNLSNLTFVLDLYEASIQEISLNVTTDEPLKLISLSLEKSITITPILDLQISNPFSSDQRTILGNLQGNWLLNSTEFATEFATVLHFPHYDFSIGIREGQNLNVDAIFEIVLAGLEIPRLEISTLQFTGNFLTRSVRAQLIVAENSNKWEFTLANRLFALEEIDMGVTFTDGEFTQFDIECSMGLAGTRFLITGNYDAKQGFSFFGSTAVSETLDLSKLADDLMKGLALPNTLPALSLTNITFSASPKSGDYYLSGHTNESWNLMDELSLQVERLALNKRQGADLKGTLILALSVRWIDETTQQEHEIELRLSADNSTSEDNIWQFEGSSGGTQPIPIDDLVRWISTKFGTDEWLPAEVQGVDVAALSLTFTSDGRLFKFTCTAEITIDDVSVPISLDINLEKDNKEKYSKGFGGTIEIEGLLFDLKFNRNEANESILIGSLAQADDRVIPLSQMVTNFLPADLTTDIPDIDITPNNVVFAYQKLPEGISPALFTLDMGGGHVETLGDLPLVGEYLKEYEVSITYRIALASADISTEQVASINEVLPDGFTKLPAAPGENLPAISEGFNVLASINLAGAPLQLTSGNGNGSAADAGSAGGESPANGNAGSSAAESNVTWVSLQRSVGPLYFSQVGFRFQNGRAAFLLDVSLTIAGLTFSLQGLAISSPLTAFLPELELAGFGLGYQNGPLEISGIFMRVDSGTEFSGAAIIKAQTFSLTAYGAYSEDEETRDPSMFLYAILDKVLGGPSFFYVTGLALGFGYNRDVIVPAIENVADFPLVAAARQPVAAENPLAAAKAVLDDLKNSVPPKIGAYWVAAGVRFSSFQLIDSFALLLVKFGQELDIVLLGISTLRLPKDKSLPPYLYAELQFKVSVQPAAGVIKAEAQLTDNSYLIDPEASLRGGFAFYAWFAGAHNGDFVLSLGGYHPRFAVPSHYPQNVPAITINWPLPQYKLSIKGTAYFALTPSSIMAGGTLQAVYDSGAIWASFTARADFLINWKPFFYDISLHLMLQVRATLDTLFGPISAETSLSANLHLWGPEFAGTAHVEWYFVSFDIAFGDADRPTHRFLEWPEFRDAFLPKAETDTASSGSGQMAFAQLPICRLNISSGLVAEIKNGDEVEWVVNPDELMLATETFMPATEVSFQVSQDDVATVMSGADIGFRPLGSGAVRSTHQITIRDSESGQVLNLVDEWAWAPDGRRQGVPAELWHTVNTEKEPAPSADILPNRLVGLDGLRPRADQDNLLSKKKTPELELLTFKFDPLPEKYLPLSIGTDSAPVFKVSEETDPFHFTEDLAAIPSSLEKIKETAQTDLVNTNRVAVLKAARTAGFALETDGKLEILVETVETAFQAPPMLGFLGSTGIRQRTVDPAKGLPLDEPPPSLRETAVRLVALLYQYKYAAAARISDTVMGGHVVPPDPHSDKVTFRKAAEVSGPEAVTAASITSAPAQKLAVGQSQTWQLESEDPNEALKTAIVLENSRGQRLRIVSLDRYGRLLNDETVDGRATSIRHDLDRQTAHLLLTGLPVPEAVSGPESKSTSNQTVGWNSASTLIQMQPRLFVGDEVLVRSQASRRRRQAGDSGVDLIEGLAAVNQNLHIDSRGDLTSGWLRTFLPAGNDLQTLALALRRSELAAPARPNSVVQVVRENGDSLQLKPIFIVRESEVELILLYSLPGDLRLEKGKTHVVLTETTAGWQIDGVMGIRERPGRVRANWSQYRLQPDVTRTAAAPDLTAQVALVLNE